MEKKAMALSIEEQCQIIIETNNGLKASQQTEELFTLLQTLESVLSSIEQNSPQELLNVILPLNDTLTSQKLIKHTDMNLKCSVTSCVAELLRIIAPDAPFNDDQFKEIFEVSIAVLEQLYQPGGHCYEKAESVLLTLTRIRLPVMLLDLESHALILEMFNHFLKHVRSDHPEDVFSAMVAIMVMICKEAETIPSDLLSLLLSSVRKENQEKAPMTLKLGEQVITECADKLKCHIVSAVNKGDINLDDYTEIVVSIYHNGTNARENNDAEKDPNENSPTKDAENGTKTDEADANPGKGKEIRDCEMSNGAGSEKSSDEQAKSEGHVTSLPSKEDGLKAEMASAPRKIGAKKEAGKKVDSIPKKRGPKRKYLRKHEGDRSGSADSGADSITVDPIDVVESVPEKRGSKMTCKRGNLEKAELESLPPKRGRKPNSLLRGYERSSKRSANKRRSDTPSTLENVTVLKPEDPRKCSEKSKASEPSETDVKTQALSIENEASAQDEKKTPKLVIKLRKEPEENSLAEETPTTALRRSARLIVTSEKKKESAGKTEAGPRSGRRRKRTDFENKGAGSSKRGSKSMRKKSRGKEDTSESPDLGYGLVGRSIMVWWPIDKVYYEGVVHSYDPETNKHAVHYIDGDKEVLNLQTQRWEVLGADPLPTEGEIALYSPTLVDTKAKKKMKSREQAKEETTGSLSSDSDVPKILHRIKGYGSSYREKHAMKLKKAKESKAVKSSGRKGKSKSVNGKEAIIYSESSEERNDIKEIQSNDSDSEKAINSSPEIIDLPDVRSKSNNKAKSSDVSEEKDEGLKCDGAMDISNSDIDTLAEMSKDNAMNKNKNKNEKLKLG